MNLLEELATYLAGKVDMQLGKQAFFNEMPDEPAECFCVQEKSTTLPTLPQIDAVSRRVVLSIRAPSHKHADKLATELYRWMWCSDEETDNPTGFLELREGLYVFSDVRGTPIWDKSDQKGRKYYTFEAVVTTQKL